MESPGPSKSNNCKGRAGHNVRDPEEMLSRYWAGSQRYLAECGGPTPQGATPRGEPVHYVRSTSLCCEKMFFYTTHTHTPNDQGKRHTSRTGTDCQAKTSLNINRRRRRAEAIAVCVLCRWVDRRKSPTRLVSNLVLSKSILSAGEEKEAKEKEASLGLGTLDNFRGLRLNGSLY